MARVTISRGINGGYIVFGLNVNEAERMMDNGKFSLGILDDDDYEFDPPELLYEYLDLEFLVDDEDF